MLSARLLEENRPGDEVWNMDARPASCTNTRVCSNRPQGESSKRNNGSGQVYVSALIYS